MFRTKLKSNKTLLLRTKDPLQHDELLRGFKETFQKKGLFYSQYNCTVSSSRRDSEQRDVGRRDVGINGVTAIGVAEWGEAG